MGNGSFKLAEQINNYGFFGSIQLHCTTVIGNSRKLDLVMPDRFNKWQHGIKFGAQFFVERVIQNVELSVEVINVEFHDVDSSNTIFAYVTFNALLNATQLKVKNQITFDRESKSFVFPR